MDNNLRQSDKKTFKIPAGIGLILMALRSLLIPFEGIIGMNIIMSPMLLIGGIWFMQGPIKEFMEFVERIFTMILENPGSAVFLGITLTANFLLAVWGIVIALIVMTKKYFTDRKIPTAFAITSAAVVLVPFVIEEINWTIVAFFGMLETGMGGVVDGAYFIAWILGIGFNVVARIVSLILDIAPIVFIAICAKHLLKKDKSDADRLTNE